MVASTYESGAKFIYPAFGVTLRQNQRDWYYKKLDEIFPNLKERYIRSYGNSYECRSPESNKLWQVTKNECETLGVFYKMDDIVKGYKHGYGDGQLTLF